MATPNIDVAFFLDTTSNLGEVDGHPAWKAPAPGTCNENRFSFPVPTAFASVHLGLQLIRYEGTGSAVWVEWADPGVKAVDLRDPSVSIGPGTPSTMAIPADDAGRATVTINAHPMDLESGVRDMEASLDGSSWRSVPVDPTIALTGFGGHSVRLRAVDNAGRAGEPVTFSVRAFGRPSATAQPGTSGRPRTGDVLDAGRGTWDPRGSDVDAFALRWLRNGIPIEGANGASYQATDRDVGTRLSVRISAHNEAGWSAPADSPATAPVDGQPARAGHAAIIGAATVGTRLEASAGAWTGTGLLRFGYQWERCRRSGSGCASIPGAVGGAYVVSSSDLGATLRAVISGSDAWGSDVALTEATDVVVQPAGPVAPTEEADRPQMQVAPSVGAVTSTSVGFFSGSRPFSYSFRWLRCDPFGDSCRVIAGANRQSYRATSADFGRTLRVDVTAKNASGVARSRTRASALVTNAGSSAPGTAPASEIQVTLTTPFRPGKVGDGSLSWQLPSSRLDLEARATRYRVSAGRSLIVSGRFSGDLGARPRTVRISAVPIVDGAGRYGRTVSVRVGRGGRFAVRLRPLVNSTIVIDVPSSHLIQGARLAIGRAGVVPRIRVSVTAQRVGGLLSSPRAIGRMLPHLPGVQLIWQARAGAVQRLVCAPGEQPRSGPRGAIRARCSGVGIDPSVEFRLAFVPGGASASLLLAAASPWQRAAVR